MNNIRLGKITRISGECLLRDGNESKKFSGFIRSIDGESFTGISINLEGEDKEVMYAMRDKYEQTSFLKGSLVNGNLTFSQIPRLNTVYDYKLVHDNKNNFYGSSFSIEYLVSIDEPVQSADKFIPTAYNHFASFTKVNFEQIKDQKEEKIMINLLAANITNWMYNSYPDDKAVIDLMKAENASLLSDAFASRGVQLSKKIFDKNH